MENGKKEAKDENEAPKFSDLSHDLSKSYATPHYHENSPEERLISGVKLPPTISIPK